MFMQNSSSQESARQASVKTWSIRAAVIIGLVVCFVYGTKKKPFFLLSVVPLPGRVSALTLEEGLKVVAETGRDVKIAQSNGQGVTTGALGLSISSLPL